MINPENSNQTKFAFEEPIFTDINVDLPVEETVVNPEKKKKINKKLFVIIGITFFIILLLLIIILAANKKPPQIPVIEEEEPQEVINLGPFEERINNARLYLEVADPSNQDLTFPPVDMELRLDEKKSR